MKTPFVSLILVMTCVIGPITKVQAQDPISEVIRQGIIKVIKAVDLKIQRLQTKTIWLQNAQKVVENEMAKVKLQEIADCAQKQQTLYKDYFDELSKVKTVIIYYHSIKEITGKQLQLVNEYKRSMGLFKRDRHFTPEEILYMEQVCAGILEQSARNLDEVLLVTRSFTTQMSDAARLELLNGAVTRIDENYSDLKAFNQENALLSVARAKDENEIATVKDMYGLQ